MKCIDCNNPATTSIRTLSAENVYVTWYFCYDDLKDFGKRRNININL